MSITFGGGKLNLNPCTEDDNLRNLQVLQTFITNTNNTIEAGAVDNFTVSVDSTDLPPGDGGSYDGPGYLYDKLYPHSTYNATDHQEVYSQTYDDGGTFKVRLFTLKAATEGAVDTYKVMSTSADTQPDYLHDAIKDPDTYTENRDIIVSCETVATTAGEATVDDPEGNEKERLFVAVAGITGYSNTGTYAWALIDDVSQFINFTDFVSDVINEYSLRRFELTQEKLRTDIVAYAKFLDDDNNMLGSETEIYDPFQLFYGKPANYTGTESGFRGIALLRRDLAENEADRWEILMMEGYAYWVVLEYAGSPDNEWQLSSYGGDMWNHKRPAADGGDITLHDPLNVVSSPVDGDKVIAEIYDPETSPVTYQEREFSRVQSGIFTANIATPISAGSAASPTSGNATIYAVYSDGTTASLGTKTLYNPYSITAIGNCACMKLSESKYLMTGPTLTSCTQEVVTSVSCVDGEIVYDTVELAYVAPECS